MKFLIKGLLIVFALSLSGCNESPKSSLSPSIRALEPNETLVMEYSACHWGCTKGTVIFTENVAQLNGQSLTLTEPEINALDQYFQNGKSREEASYCSLPIEIKFKLKKGISVINTKDLQIYPCHFGGVYLVTPEDLMYHFLRRSNEVPRWRLSADKQQESLIIEE